MVNVRWDVIFNCLGTSFLTIFVWLLYICLSRVISDIYFVGKHASVDQTGPAHTTWMVFLCSPCPSLVWRAYIVPSLLPQLTNELLRAVSFHLCFLSTWYCQSMSRNSIKDRQIDAEWHQSERRGLQKDDKKVSDSSESC